MAEPPPASPSRKATRRGAQEPWRHPKELLAGGSGGDRASASEESREQGAPSLTEFAVQRARLRGAARAT
eukprot:6064747-Alexandrium_andersonii.AAC.1